MVDDDLWSMIYDVVCNNMVRDGTYTMYHFRSRTRHDVHFLRCRRRSVCVWGARPTSFIIFLIFLSSRVHMRHHSISDVVRGAGRRRSLWWHANLLLISSCSCVIVHTRYHLSNYLLQMKTKRKCLEVPTTHALQQEEVPIALSSKKMWATTTWSSPLSSSSQHSTRY